MTTKRKPQNKKAAAVKKKAAPIPNNSNAEAILSPQDLFSLKLIVERGIDKGVFAANEVSTVGGVYDRLSALVEAIAKAPPPLPEEESSEEVKEEESTEE